MSGYSRQVKSIRCDGEKDALFVCCASFEERSTQVANLLDESYTAEHAVILWYDEPELSELRRQHREQIERRVSSRTEGKAVVVNVPLRNPVSGLRAVREHIERTGVSLRDRRVAIDCTVMTKQFLLVMLRCLQETFKGLELRVLYTYPKAYGMDQGRPMTRGLEGIVSVPSFGGTYTLSKKIMLILFLGFEGGRSLAVYEKYGPNLTIAIVGSPAYKEEWTRFSKEQNAELLNQHNVRVEYASVGDPFAVKELLESLYQDYSSAYNLYVSPMGTKVQAVGTYMFCMKHRGIQVVYPMPSVYPEANFSQGIGETWEFVLDD